MVGRSEKGASVDISAEIRSLLENRHFIEAQAGFLLPDAASQARRTILEQRLGTLTR